MVEKKCIDERKKDRDQPPTKVVIRRLPPSLSPEIFLEQILPLPAYDYFYYVKADMSLGVNAFTRAYINFPCAEDICTFKDKFDGYVFVDKKGNEYPAVVEFAPFQKVPKKKMRKADTKKGTIDQDSEFQKFVENIKNPHSEPTVPIESYLEELENKRKELKANHGVPKMTTPLIEFIKRKREEKKASLQRQREDRKKREQERRKARDEEKRRRKEKEKRDKEKLKEKELKKDEQPIKLLKNPEREMEKQKDECDLIRCKDELDKPIKEREKLRFSKENREKIKIDRQGQDRLKTGREGRFGERNKYSKDDRINDKSDSKFKTIKDDRCMDKSKNRDDKADRPKSNRDKYGHDRNKCYQANGNNNNSNNCRDDKKSRHDKQSKHERQDKFDRIERQDKFERHEKADKFERHEKPDKFERHEKPDKFERYEKPDKFERHEKTEKFERHEKADKFERHEKADKFERHEKADKFERHEKADKFERHEKADKFERHEKPDRSEKLEKPERTEKQETDDFDKYLHDKKNFNKIDKSEKSKERPERALYDPRKALERRQQSETARMQYHEKGNNNTDKGGNISETKAGSQEKVLPERRERNSSHDKNKGNLDKNRVDNNKTNSEKVSYSKGGYNIDKAAANKGSAEVASLSSIAASMEGGVSAENSIPTEDNRVMQVICDSKFVKANPLEKFDLFSFHFENVFLTTPHTFLYDFVTTFELQVTGLKCFKC
ncbi:regulator of nonsense transcripts 3B-like isoform X1 [Octopus vulgaris]|uniref:Regulator of nonsense transcripts 3B-like isoform X1 n=1 Tax=Octopus vulgaris TaxID=6645 RepID=A0AA36B3T7_OCTVU|nr:regulator of nonsense transcripts 3B-like isoform X1 [Octopus vulgaris]